MYKIRSSLVDLLRVGLSAGLIASYMRLEIIVFDDPVSAVKRIGYPCTVPLIYIYTIWKLS